jgi:hypothetical protein
MPALLENFAEQHTRHLMDSVRTMEDEFQALKALPDSLQAARRAAVAARMFAGLVPSTVSIMEQWVQVTEDMLREGINGLDFRIFASVGASFIQACEEVVDMANKICQQAEAFGVSSKTKDARDILSEAQVQMRALKSKVMSWKKIADRRPPEIDPALLERGAEQICEGRFKTGEQILEEIRNHTSSK